MPLKEADLKTLDVYKHAIKQDVSRITATTETKFWIYGDVELADKKKNPVLLVLVDDAGVRNFFHSKRPVCTGMCHLVDGAVAFEPKAGRVPYRLLRTAVPLFLAKKLYIPPNVNPDDESGEAGEGARQGQADPSAVAAALPVQDLAAGWSKLSKDIEAAIAANPGRKDALSQAASGIPDLVTANNSKEATARMDKVREMLNAPPPPPPLPSPELVPPWSTPPAHIRLPSADFGTMPACRALTIPLTPPARARRSSLRVCNAPMRWLSG